MRIINEDKTEVIGRCPICNSELGILKSDIQLNWLKTKAFLVCPICKNKINISDEDLPFFGLSK